MCTIACTGESSSSSGTDTLTDPLEKMALDVTLLDRQYRKLMDRQKQTHIVVGGMNEYLYSPESGSNEVTNLTN